MISIISGQVVSLAEPTVCVMTESGIGYDIDLTLPDFYLLKLHQSVTLFTHLHVREDAHLLYGFDKKISRDVFRQLIKISGVGSKMALAMLSNMTVAELMHTIESQDDLRLTKVPGIGKKTAQRLLIELQDKLNVIDGMPTADILPSLSTNGDVNRPTSVDGNVNEMKVIAEIEDALKGLGYRENEAQSAIKIAKQQLDSDKIAINSRELLRAALKQFGK